MPLGQGGEARGAQPALRCQRLVGQGLLTYAISWFTPLVLGLSLLLQPAVSAVLGWVLFGEWLSVTDMVGTMAIAAALVLVRLPSRA